MNLIVLAAFLLTSSVMLIAAEPNATRLQQLFQRHPEADTNRDGTLSLDEANAFKRALRRGKQGGGGATTGDNETAKGSTGSHRLTPNHIDVRYGPHERNVLDLWLAPSGQPTPLVVFIHGGGFENGSKAGISGDMLRGCLKAGVSFMSINYRFRDSAPIQDILRDCARSIQYIRTKASQYNIEPTRIAAYGRSAGAGTSLWLAFHDDLADPESSDPVLRASSRLVAAGAYNTQATYDTHRWREFLGAPDPSWERAGATAAFYGVESEADLTTESMKRVLHEVDMLAHISKDDPPVFLYTKAPDGPLQNRGHYVHHPSHARAVKKACDAVGVPATVYFAETEPMMPPGEYEGALLMFLLRHLAAVPER